MRISKLFKMGDYTLEFVLRSLYPDIDKQKRLYFVELGLANGSPAGPLLRGPVDIVLPVPAPPLNTPSATASELAAGASLKNTTWESFY